MCKRCKTGRMIEKYHGLVCINCGAYEAAPVAALAFERADSKLEQSRSVPRHSVRDTIRANLKEIDALAATGMAWGAIARKFGLNESNIRVNYERATGKKTVVPKAQQAEATKLRQVLRLRTRLAELEASRG